MGDFFQIFVAFSEKLDMGLPVDSTMQFSVNNFFYKNGSMCSELAVAAALARVLLLQSKGEEDIDK